jgi:ABC-type branched-subunit amino acid transport system substrate-binding protein
MRAVRQWAVVALVVANVAAACSAQPARPIAGATAPSLIVVDAPFSLEPAIAREIVRGAELAVGEINASGGVNLSNRRVRLNVTRSDSRLSPSTTVDNVRRAARDGALAVISEGTGTTEAAAVDPGLPIAIVYRGDTSLVDITQRRNVFRIAPTNRAVALRLAEYVVPKNVKIAVVRDDSGYGTGGGEALDRALAHNRDSVVATATVPVGSDPAPQIRVARDAGATALIVWARPATLATVVRAVRQAGWNVPVFTAPSGEDPIVRQQLADHPEWLEGMVVAMSRLTAEKGPAPFERFRAAYEQRFGRQEVGVKSAGHAVVQAPDWAMYSYDFVRIAAAAMVRSGETRASAKLVSALEQVAVPGANGDERGFNERNHEGVVDDDVFFAAIRNMVLVPVKDDPLSATLPLVPQT